MDSNIEISLLLDFYGTLLTEKQQDIANLYYNGDYSLSEIADDLKISRQGVRDSLKRAEAQLKAYEDKLNLIKKTYEYEDKLSDIHNIAKSVLDSTDINELKHKILEIHKKSRNNE